MTRIQSTSYRYFVPALTAVVVTTAAFAKSFVPFYLIIIVQYTMRFGDPMRDGYLHDVFGVGISGIFITFHQSIGLVLGLAALAAVGLTANRTRSLSFAALPFVLVFLFHIAARTAI